jgi:iron complex transport system permease protein
MRGMRTRLLDVALGLLALAAFLLSLGTGPMAMMPWTELAALVGHGDERAVAVVQELRLPRAALGALVGFSLGLAGAALQGLLRNPLAEPVILGVAPSAGLGAVIVFYYGLAGASPIVLPVAGMVGALTGVALLVGLVGRDGGSLATILAGMAVNGVAVSLTALAISLAPSPWAVSEMMNWLMGSIRDRSLGDAAFAAPFMVAGWALMLARGWTLDALSLGEDAAASLGADARTTRLRIVVGCGLAVGAATAVAGGIAFVGLIVPHVLRPWVGYRPGRLLLASGFGGAILVCLADVVVRVLPTVAEVNLGVLTALLGAPFFLALILRARRTAR